MNIEKIDLKPLVSIAIITYNQKDFLKKCIDSCLTQEYSNFEIIVADDYSTDGTQEMLLSLKKQYPDKFKLSLAKINQGITFNSNAALNLCNGKYIAWMGGDDLMLPNKLERQVKYLESNPHCTICYHNLDVFDSDSDETLFYFNEKVKLSGDVKTAIKCGTFNGACSTMVRASKSPKHGFNTLIPVASDWLYWVDTLANGGTINYIDEILGRYRRHNGNVTKKSSVISQNELDHLVTCQIILKQYPTFTKQALYSYGRLLINLRFKLPYLKAICIGFVLRPRIKVLMGIFVYLLTFGVKKI